MRGGVFMTFSKEAEALYIKIKELEIKDNYARPKLDLGKRLPSNVWELVEDSYKTEALALAGYDTTRASDFEKLSAYIECISLMPDNALKLIFLEEIEAISGEKCNRLDACEIWKKCNEAINHTNFGVVDISREINANIMTCSDKYMFVGDIPTNLCFDIKGEIKRLTEGYDKPFGEWSESIISTLKSKRPPYDIAVDLDSDDIKFIRGDHYHAGLVFDKLCRGEGDISAEERGQLFFWLVCHLASRLGEDAVLHINIGDNVLCARELLSYLCMRGICPSVALGVTPKSSRQGRALADVCLISPQRIYLELVLGIEDTPRVLSERIEALLAFYPASRLKFGGILTASALLSASHRYARKAICQAISEIADDNAEDIIKAIFS